MGRVRAHNAPSSSHSSTSKKKSEHHHGGGLFGGLSSVASHVLHNPVTHETAKLATQSGKDIGNIATHTPGGLYALGKAGGLDVYDFNRHPLRKHPFSRSSHIASGMIHNTIQDFRHPLRHPVYTLLDALSIVPAVGEVAGPLRAVSTASKVGEAGGRLSRAAEASRLTKAGRAAKASRTPTRILTTKSRTAEEEAKLSKARGVAPGKVGRVHSVEVPASVVASTRAVQATADFLRSKSGRMSAKVQKESAREKQIHDRMTGAEVPVMPDKFIASVKTVGKKPVQHLKASALHPVREFNAGVRAGRLYRPGYVPANALGNVSANVIQGSFTPSVIRQARRLARDAETGPRVQNMMGGGVSRAAADMGVSKGGVIETLTKGAGESLGRVTDYHARARAFVHEAKKQGYKSDAEISQLLQAGPGSAAGRDLVQITRRAENSAINFSHSVGPGLSTRLSNQMAQHVFLGSWLRASGRYGKHVIAEHPIKAALMAQASREAPNMNDALGKIPHPGFLDAYIPVGRRGKNPTALNATGYSLFDMPADVARQILSGKKDLRNLVGPLNPAQHAALVALLGYDPFTGKTLKKPTTKERLGFAAQTELQNPWTQFLPGDHLHWGGSKTHPQYVFPHGRFWDTKEQRQRRLLPRTKRDVFLQWLLGGTFSPTPVNPDVARKMKH